MRHTPLIIACFVTAVASGCSKNFSELGDIANGDDFSPYVTVGEVKSGNLTSLGPSEAVVAGIGNVEQVTPTNRVHLKIVELAELKDIKVEEKPFLTAIKRVSNRQGQWVVSDMIYPKDWDGGPINRQFMITVLNLQEATGDHSKRVEHSPTRSHFITQSLPPLPGGEITS